MKVFPLRKNSSVFSSLDALYPILLKSDGRGPPRLFWLRSRTLSSPSSPSPSGMLPVSWLPPGGGQGEEGVRMGCHYPSSLMGGSVGIQWELQQVGTVKKGLLLRFGSSGFGGKKVWRGKEESRFRVGYAKWEVRETTASLFLSLETAVVALLQLVIRRGACSHVNVEIVIVQ